MWKSKARFLNSKLYSIWFAQRTKQNLHLTFNLCIPFLNWFALVNQSLQMEFFVQIVPGRIIAAATHSSPHCWPWNMTSQNRSVWLNKTYHAECLSFFISFPYAHGSLQSCFKSLDFWNALTDPELCLWLSRHMSGAFQRFWLDNLLRNY